MADKDTGEPDESSLELPSLFGRKKKRGKAEAPAETPPEPAASEETAVIEPVAAPVAEPVAEPAPAPEPTRAPARAPAPVAEETAVIPPVAEPAPVATAGARREDDQPVFDAAPEGGARKAPRPKREAPSLPSLGASVAALVVGALVGLLGVGLTFGSLKACDAVTGTDSCGGPGLLVVLVVVVLMIMAGSALLRAFGVPEPGGLSFLGVAIFVALCLVFLLEQLLEPWMVVVGPALCLVSFGIAHWVVNRFNTELLAEEGAEPHDVR